MFLRLENVLKIGTYNWFLLYENLMRNISRLDNDNIIRRPISWMLLLIFFISSLLLTACNEVIETDFGEEEEKAYIRETTEGNGEDTDLIQVSEEISSKYTKDEDVELDINNLPKDLEALVPLCDALNICQFERGTNYSTEDDEFIWNSVRIAFGDCDWDKEDIILYENTISVGAVPVREYLYAMFGNVPNMPPIPKTMIDDRSAYYAGTSKGTEIRYDFSIGDRGLSCPELRKAVQHPDTSITLEVALIDVTDGSEIVDFNYDVITNTKNLSTSVRYQYAIVGSEPADELTKTKMEGIPYITFVKQLYGKDSFDVEDAQYNSIEEIPWFTSNKNLSLVDRINDRIREELLNLSDSIDPEVEWVEIKSYPVTGSEYIQVLVSYNIYPCYGTCGDITSYNYCVDKNSLFDIKKALIMAEISEEDLYAKASEGDYGEYGENAQYKESQCQGFFILDDGSIDFYLKVFFDSTTGGEPFDIIASINSKTNAIKTYGIDDDLLDDKQVDVMVPPLTHGK